MAKEKPLPGKTEQGHEERGIFQRFINGVAPIWFHRRWRNAIRLALKQSEPKTVVDVVGRQFGYGSV
jgi:hypothetical protein